MHLKTDIRLMRRALDLAAQGRGGVEPNPLVGCVVVKEGRIVGEGFHRIFGGPHAEAEALSAGAEPPVGAEVFVNLEPCCHTNKKTPPCVPRLVKAGVRRVVIGCLDPNPQVAGRGAAQLREAGIEVQVGVCELESKQLNAPFFTRLQQRRPYVTLKWAESADRKVAGPGGRPIRISGDRPTSVVHALRGRCDAILVGIGTVLEDDPLLTARGEHTTARRVLRRIVLDTHARIPLESRLVQSANEFPLSVAVARTSVDDPAIARRIEALRCRGVEIMTLDPDVNGRPSLKGAMESLAVGEGATHLLVEGGPQVHASFLREELVDRLWVISSPMAVGDVTAPGAVDIPAAFQASGARRLGADLLTEYHFTGSLAYAGTFPSPDFQLAGGLGSK